MPSAYESSPMNLIRAIELAKTIERIFFLNILIIPISGSCPKHFFLANYNKLKYTNIQKIDATYCFDEHCMIIDI